MNQNESSNAVEFASGSFSIPSSSVRNSFQGEASRLPTFTTRRAENEKEVCAGLDKAFYCLLGDLH